MPSPTDQIATDPQEDDAATGGSSDASGSGDGEGGASESSGSASPVEGADVVDSEGGETEILLQLEGEQAANDAERQTENAPEWLSTIRKENRQKDRRIRELERQVAAVAPAPIAPVAGPEPTLETCDFDAARYARELKDWMGRDAEAKRVQGEQRRAVEASQAQYLKRINDVEAVAGRMSIAGAEDAREGFESGLSVIQQAIIMNGPEDVKISAQLRHAIGANPSVAKRLAAIQDPVKFAFAVAELVPKMKINRKAAPTPERRLNSGAVGTAAVDNALAKAQERADKTGDRTEVARLMRQRQKAA